MAVPHPKKLEGVRLEVLNENQPPLRVYHPEIKKTNGALLWIHGGGYIIGSAGLDDRFCALTARELGMIVVSVDYRLAPDFAFPVPLEDCFAAWNWLQQSAGSLGVDPKKIIAGGGSAGGALAACLVQRVHDAGGNKALGQWLFCPMIDDRTALRRDLTGLKHPVWNNSQNALAWRFYLNAEPGEENLPRYSVPARREDLRGLPPAWIGVGDVDLFYEEDRKFADRLIAAGVDVEFESVPGGPHGFVAWAFDTEFTQDHIAKAHRWLRRVLA